VAAAELKCYIASIKQGWLAQLIHASLKRGAEPALVQAARRSYQAAVQALPHVHDDVLASLRGGDQVADPAKCFACGIYSEPLIVNYGLFLGETGRPDLASRVLEAATVLAPWDAHAAASLGAAYRHLGQRAAAAEQYRRALSLRPGFEGYQHALNELS
jgi:tetratricopeptide (TPR) repeat protein